MYCPSLTDCVFVQVVNISKIVDLAREVSVGVDFEVL